MEPNINPVAPTPEQPSPTNPESSNSELGQVSSPEQLPQPEKAPRPAAAESRSMTLPPVQLPQSPVPAPVDDAVAVSDDTPALADDVDVIEREWVNKAKGVIDQTRDDPHAQEAGFEQLQVEYQKKRYGRDIKRAA